MQGRVQGEMAMKEGHTNNPRKQPLCLYCPGERGRQETLPLTPRRMGQQTPQSDHAPTAVFTYLKRTGVCFKMPVRGQLFVKHTVCSRIHN